MDDKRNKRKRRTTNTLCFPNYFPVDLILYKIAPYLDGYSIWSLHAAGENVLSLTLNKSVSAWKSVLHYMMDRHRDTCNEIPKQVHDNIQWILKDKDKDKIKHNDFISQVMSLATLTMYRGCQNCSNHPTVRKVYFEYQVRWCRPCLLKMTITDHTYVFFFLFSSWYNGSGSNKGINNKG
jgi:hypothetical protein